MSETVVRIDGRAPGDLRPLKVQMGYLEWAEGSALLEMGKTVVLVSASFEPRVPCEMKRVLSAIVVTRA